MSVLVCKSLASIVVFWRPGSRGDDWTWADEYVELTAHPSMAPIEERVHAEGIGFADKTNPVQLGDDGRVWDGHHRICLAIKYGIPSLMVDLVGGDAQ